MGKLYDEIDDRLREFIAAQRLFFVATAPSGDSGHVNCSPKGLDTFRVLGPRSVAYLDFVGSGTEARDDRGIPHAAGETREQTEMLARLFGGTHQDDEQVDRATVGCAELDRRREAREDHE